MGGERETHKYAKQYQQPDKHLAKFVAIIHDDCISVENIDKKSTVTAVVVAAIAE